MIQLDIMSDWVEFSALVASIVFSIAISFWYCKKDSGRPKMSIGPILVSLIASSTSGVTMLGKPAESYAHGVQFVVFSSMGFVFNYIFATLVLLPVIFKLKTASVYEYFDLRFDGRVRKLVSVPFITMRTLAISLGVVPPVIVIHQFSGIGEASITIALTLLTAFYTTIGGFKGVVWTDTLQGAVMLVTMTVLTTISVVKVGGFGRVFEIAYETNRLSTSPFSWDPTERISIWSYGSFLYGVSTFFINQSTYQRIKSLSTEKEIRNAMRGMILGLILFAMAASFVGLSIYAYYYGCDPKNSQLVTSYSNVVVYWIDEIGRNIKGIRGLYIAGITCASISTMSTHLNTVSEMICTELSDGNPPRYAVRLVTFGLGLVTTVIALIIKNTGNLVELAFTIYGLEGIASGLFLLGILFVSANAKGALVGGILTTLLTIISVIGARLTNVNNSSDSFHVKIMRTDLCAHNFNSTISVITRDESANESFFLFRLSPFCMGTLSTILTVVIGVVVSAIFPVKSQGAKLHADLFCPLVHRFLKRENLSNTVEDSSNPLVRRRQLQQSTTPL